MHATVTPRPVKAIRGWRVSNPEQDGCDWCGETPGNGHLFSYDQNPDKLNERNLTWLPAYCGLHCWGQANGMCEL